MAAESKPIGEIHVPLNFSPTAAMRWIGEWSAVRDAPEVTVVVPKGAFITPGGMTLLVSCLCARRAKGLATFIRANHDDETFRYMQRMDACKILGITVEERFSRRDAACKFVPLRQLNREADARELADELRAFVEAQLPSIPPSLSNLSRFILEELATNVVQHARAGDTGCGFGQAYRKSKRFEFSVCDAGIGIRASLENNVELQGRIGDDGEALRLAISDGISGSLNPSRNMGAGLSEFTRVCRRMDAELWLMSKGACLHQVNRGQVTVVDEIILVTPFDGTWVCFSAPIPQ